MPAELKRWDYVRATFQPARVDDLVDGSQGWIGWRGLWEAAWIIEPEDEICEGRYDGQWAMKPTSEPYDPASLPPFAWTPFEDLAEVDPHAR